MTVLRMHGLAAIWSAAKPIFEEVTLTLDRGRYGLVGANGAGKTTLLAILAGVLTPHEGSVSVTPRQARIVYCPQRVDTLEADVRALGESTAALAAELRGRLALEPSEPSRWSTLSPGERKRWQVAAALAREPDVLLLDEPTNHLDESARRRLLGALRRFDGIGVIVSHDRAVLDELTHATLRVHERRVTLYPGPYSAARELWVEQRSRQEQAHDRAREQTERVEAQLERARRTQAAAGKNINTGARMKDKNDSDARSIMASSKARWAEAHAGRVVRTVRARAEQARAAIPTVERDVTLGAKVFANYERAPSPVLFHLDVPRLYAGEHEVLRDVRLNIGREERVRITGENGAGKTTVLRALVSSLLRPERVLYLPQELEQEELLALSARLAALDREARGRLLSIFAALGSDPARVLESSGVHYSPGEAKKLLLAEALARSVWALVLDEPTNHLDLPSIERLEAALVDYPGCVIVVTHDDAFARRATARTLSISSGTITR